MRKNDWYEGPAQELSFFTVNEIIRGYSNMYKKYNIAFFNVLFHSKDGIVRMIRKKSELTAIIDYIEKQKDEFIIEQLKKTYDLYKKLKNQINTNLNKDTWNKIFFLCKELWIYNLFSIYVGYSFERNKIKKIVNKHYDLFSKVRNDISNILILEDFLKNQKADLSELSAEEITKFLKNNKLPKESELKERRNEYLLFMKNLKLIKIPKKDIKKTISLYIKEKEIKNITQVKGMTAFKKNVRGYVKLILKKEKLSSIKKGDILVTISTNPDYVPYLSKVKGIVTDRGGIVSHAAIVSREMKIPCIVGTKIGTKVFKDGDLVEVDANKGIVKILKRK